MFKPRGHSGSVTNGLDSRTGLGYGKSSEKFHKQRTSNSSFPYADKDQYADDEELDIEDQILIRKKLNLSSPDGTDHAAKTDKFYYVAGNTKLSDCFFRANKVLQIIQEYQFLIDDFCINEDAAVYITSGPSRKTGTKRGYFSPPPALKGQEEDDKDEFYGINDFIKILKKRSGN